MVKICHVTSVHNRYDVRIFEKECTSLCKNGYDTSLVVNDDMSDEVKRGVKIRSTGFSPKNRMSRILFSKRHVLNKVLEVNATIYHLHDPELLTIVKPLVKNNKHVIYDAHEDTEIQIMDKEWIPYFLRKIVSICYRTYMRHALKQCAGVISVTPALIEKLSRYHKNVEMITNYPIIEEQKENESYYAESEPYIFFAGGVSEQWCHDKVIEAVQQIDNVKYIYAGRGEKEYLKKLEALDKKFKSKYIGKIPHKMVNGLYSGAIAGVAINDCSQIQGEGTLGNTKLFEVMSASKPVICRDYRLWKEIVETYQCGICVNNEEIDAIVAAIKYLVDNPKIASEMGKNGRKAVEQVYNWETQAEKLIKFYQDIF